MADNHALTVINTEDLAKKLDDARDKLGLLAGDVSEELAEKIENVILPLTQQGMKGDMDGQNRTAIPLLALKQLISSSANIPQNTQPGELYSTAGGPFKSIDVIPIFRYSIRRKWSDDKIECSSHDGKHGSRYGECAVCPHGRFEKNTRPECSPGHTFFLLAEDLSSVYRMDFLKSNAQAGRNMQRLALPPALWSRSFTISTEKKTGGGKNYFILKTAPTGRRTDAEVMKVCEALYDYLYANYHQMLATQAAYAAARTNGTGGNGHGSNGASEGDVVVTDSDDGVIDFSTESV